MAINPMQMIQMIMNGTNPQQLMLSILEQGATSNSIQQNLFNMAKNNNSKGIENIARNLMKEKGFDFDKEFNSFKNNLGL